MDTGVVIKKINIPVPETVKPIKVDDWPTKPEKVDQPVKIDLPEKVKQPA